MADRCDHSESEDTNLYGADGGMPVSRCLKCDALFNDSDLVNNACMDAAEAAAPQDGSWEWRYIEALRERGYEVVPWPAHLDPPHAGTAAHSHMRRPDVSIEMIVVSNEVLEAMARARPRVGEIIYL
jgi:hypothetical protein